jgi:hypothetical protein
MEKYFMFTDTLYPQVKSRIFTLFLGKPRPVVAEKWGRLPICPTIHLFVLVHAPAREPEIFLIHRDH